MVQYMLSVLDTASNHEDPARVGGYESAEAAQASWDATGRFNEALVAEGYFVFANGLEDPKTATVVELSAQHDAGGSVNLEPHRVVPVPLPHHGP